MEKFIEQILTQMQQQQALQNENINKIMAKLCNTEAASTSKAGKQDQANPEFILEALATNITEFCYDLESNLTFDAWYTRYEDLFLIDAAKLDDAAKVRLLLRKLNTIVHSKYVDYILPKHPREITFKETVEKLKILFGNQTSLFNTRFNCLQISKSDDMDIITYTGIVNKQCEKFELSNLTLDQFKCLIFVMGLKSHSDFEIRTKLLSKLDNEASNITLDILSRECQRIANLKQDTALIENKQVHKVQFEKNKFKKRNTSESKQPKSPCWFCGDMHYARHCPYKTKRCEKCKIIGHKAGYCFAKKQNGLKDKKNNQSSHKNNNDVESKGIFVCKNISSQRKFIKVYINDIMVELQLDTASDITIISEKTMQMLNINNTENVIHKARSATGDLPLSSCFKCNVKFQNKSINTTCFVTPLESINVLGLDWIQTLQLEDMSINSICKAISNTSDTTGKYNTNTIKQSFSDLFDNKMGLCTKMKAHLVAKPDALPVFCPARPVAYAVRQSVEMELERLQQEEIISPVNYSKWAAPVVVIKKQDGRIRLCADFSTGLNKALESHQYPLPLPEDIFATLANASVFSHIDLSDAFLQIMVDDESKHFLTINTHKGMFRYNRMVFGVKVFPAIFQQIMDQMLAGIDGATAYIDDIFLAGKSQEEHDVILQKVLERLREYGFKLKFEKCSFSLTEINYLGYIINSQGLKPNPDTITAINKMPEPTNVNELRSFLGAINFYAKFVDKMRMYRGPLDELLRINNKWNWTKQHSSCFRALKEILTSDLLLAHFDPKESIVVAADASNYGLGACILHEYSDGRMKAVCHASRSLTPSEKKYSQIEKKALAITFAVEKFHKMIFGRKFILHTDHRPLLTIFGRKSGISAHQANRLQRWAIKLLAYDFEIRFISTSSFGYADVLSRLIKDHDKENEDFVIASINFEKEISHILTDNLQNMPITQKMVKIQTKKDEILQQVLNFCNNEWPSSIEDNAALKAYFNRKELISIIDDCIMVKDRIAIPKVFQKRVLKEIHRGHPGIERTKAKARSYVYWPGIDDDISRLVKSCQQCASAAKMPIKAPLQPWPTPTNIWDRIHIDYAGPIDGLYFLVVIDAFSKWPEIVPTKSISALQTVQILNEIFSRHGYPKTVVSDNGTQFKSLEFQKFLTERGIEHLCSSPYYPMSNGQAERFVDTLKRSLIKNNNEGSVLENLQTFLLSYRTTPNRNIDNKSPAELIYNRKLNITLDLLLPIKETETVKSDNQIITRMKKQYDKKHGVITRAFQTKERVYAAIYKNNRKLKWEPGEVIERVGKVLYNVLLDSGKLVRAHNNQLRPCASEHSPQSSADSCEWVTDPYEQSRQQDLQHRGAHRETTVSAAEQHGVSLRRSQRRRRPVDRYVPD